MKIALELFGHDPHGQPIHWSTIVDAVGTKPSPQMASGILASAIKRAEEKLVSVKQISASVANTHEILFSYVCGVSDRE